jgi:hypothetical protein
VARILSSLGLGWARKLDAYLGQLEDKIQRPFQFLLAKINEVINVVNRIVTLDGLIQRVALIRSLARDYKFAGNIWWNTMHRAADPAALRRLKEPGETKTPRQNSDDTIALWRGDTTRSARRFRRTSPTCGSLCGRCTGSRAAPDAANGRHQAPDEDRASDEVDAGNDEKRQTHEGDDQADGSS